MTWLGGVLLVAAFLGVLNFVVTYLWRDAWWATNVGRNAMAFAVSELVLLGLSVATMVFGRFPGREAISFAAFAAFTFVAWWRWLVLLRAPKRRKDAS